VFSIWQGGTCTGTFRLPIAELPRMVAALQRGPHGDSRDAGGPHDDRRATELRSMPGQQGGTGHGAGHASGQYGPGDFGAGDSGDFGPDDYGRTEQRDGPDRGPAPEPDTGYSDPGFPAGSPGGYVPTGAHGRYEQETRAVYPDDSLPGGPGGYREERGDRYSDEPPTGVYRGDLLSQEHRDGGHRQDRHGGHQDDPLSAGYRAAPRDGGRHDDPLPSGYTDDPLSAGYRDEPRGGPYRADSLPGGYRADLSGGHHDDPLPASGYPDESRSGGHRAERHGGDYPDDPLTRGYPEERHTGGYPDDPRGGYAEEPMTARYRAEPPTGDYPTGPSEPAIDGPDYQAPPGNAGYSPARPYVAPVPGGARGAGEGRRRRRGGGQEESDPSPDSFPYGRPAR
jgi:hypothetical protein